MLFNKITKVERRRALIILSVFVVLIAIYLTSIWEYFISKNIIKYSEDIDRDTVNIILLT